MVDYFEPPELTSTDSRWVDMAREGIAQGSTGCLFAKNRATGREPAQTWVTTTLDWPLQEHAIEDMQQLLKSSNVAQGVMIVVPKITTPSDLAELFTRLEHSNHWHLVELDSQDPDEALIGLRWPLPGTKFVSEVLVLGPIEGLPQTRQLPVTTLVFRTVPRSSTEGRDDVRVHLADMEFLPLEEKHMDKERGKPVVWGETERQKAALLGGTVDRSGDKPQTVDGKLMHAAKARVTARFTREVWESRPKNPDT